MPTVPYVLPLPTPERGGPLAAWMGAWGIAATAPRFGLAVRVVSPDGMFDLPALQAALTSHRSPDRAGAPPRRSKRLAKDVRQWAQQRAFARRAVQAMATFDEVPFVLTRHTLFGSAGAACARVLDVPLVTWLHAALVQEATSWGTRRFAPGLVEALGERRPLRRADVRVAVTQRVLDDLGLGGPRDLVLGNGTLLERFTGGSERARRVVWTGSFRGFHGVDTLVGAFDGIDAELVLVGSGSQAGAIARQVETRGLQQRVRLPGFVAPTELPTILADCAVGVVASGVPLEAFHYSPVKLREYAAAGLVVCVPLVGEMAALAGEPWVVGHDNTEAGLRTALREALARSGDPSVGDAARAYAAAHYGWEPWWTAVLGAVRDR